MTAEDAVVGKVDWNSALVTSGQIPACCVLIQSIDVETPDWVPGSALLYNVVSLPERDNIAAMNKEEGWEMSRNASPL
jgi:hypothetical protein